MGSTFVGSRYPREREEGKVEYKLKLVGCSEERLSRIATQMKYRLVEGGGEAFYVVGVSDDGDPVGISEEELEETLRILEGAASEIGARLLEVRRRRGRRGLVSEILVRVSREEAPPVQVSVATLGNVDAGKSTMISVLCTGQLDDGNGLAMKRIARFLHEIESGRTSSVSTHLLGFDDRGEVVNAKILNPLDEAEIYLRSSKIVAMVDLGGHERYLRTTLRGVMARLPDYTMLVVGANAGLLTMGREHLGVSIALRIPVFVVVTKIDMVAREKLREVLEEIRLIMKIPGVNKLPYVIRDYDDVVVTARNMPSGRIVPIFEISNKTGEGIDKLVKFLNLLPPRMRWREHMDGSLLLYVDEVFRVRGVGTVVAGFLKSGVVRADDEILLGPFRDGSWRVCRVKSIHVNRVPVERAYAGTEATLALTNVRYDEVEKGMAVLDKRLPPRSVRRFRADFTVLRHPTTIKVGYEAVLHLGAIRSTIKILGMSKSALRTGDTDRVDLEFKYHPWYVRVGDVFIVRDARTRAIGRITGIS